MIGESGRRTPPNPRRASTPALIAALAIGLAGGPEALAQDRASDFSDRPILVLDTGGHHAPVRRLVFTQDEARLLSAGDDKVVRVWDLAGPSPSLAWTIRPPIWRARAGAIYGMALTAPDAQGLQTLALGGFGIDAFRGEIGLYRFPGAADRRQGDVAAYLSAGDRVPLPDSKGHQEVVTCLAFSPDGTLLASTSNDRTARLWDLRNRAQIGAPLIAPDQGRLNTLAFTPDGRRLATGGSDGTLRIWDVTARPPTIVAQAAPRVLVGKDPDGLAINCLAISPDDGRWLVIGRENGELFRYDLAAPNLQASGGAFFTELTQGAVEAVAIGPGGRLAASIISRRKLNPGDRPTVGCDVELRSVLDDRRKELVAPPSSNLVYALAFSPKGSYLTFAGGDRQDIRLVDLRVAPRSVVEVSYPVARGMSLWEVGWAGNTSVAYSYQQPAAAQPDAYYGFDLKDRSREVYPARAVRKAVKEYDGWTVAPLDTYRLVVGRNGVARFTIPLVAEYDGRWWDYTFLPPGPKHARPALAVACDRGVAVYRLDDGVRTRFLDGHNGPVYCLSPSPDGKWLATGSSDQTLRLWALAAADVLAPVGARFEIKAGLLSVASVEKGGFADVAGMKVGDVVDEPGLGGRRVGGDEFLKGYDSQEPNRQVAYLGHRTRPDGTNEEVRAGTTRRDRPILSLFVGLDQEWVLWMPQGFYDSSVIGDAKFLGWQVNRYSKANPTPTDFYPILTHEKALRRPKAVPGGEIERLLELADEVAVLGPGSPEIAPVVEQDRPSVVTPVLGVGGAAVQGPDGRAIAAGSPLPQVFSMAPGPLVLDWKVEPRNPRPPGPFEVRLEGEVIRPAQAPAYDPAVGVATVTMRYDLGSPGSYNFTALSDLGAGYERRVSVTAKVEGKPPLKPIGLAMLSIAPAFEDPKIPRIKASERDVKQLSPFLARHLVGESGSPAAKAHPFEARLMGRDATAGRLRDDLEKLAKLPVERGDIAVVVIETYVVTSAKGKAVESRLVVADSKDAGPMPTATLASDEVNAALESLVHRGCKVIVVLDVAHETPRWKDGSTALEWARVLRNQYDVISILATTGKPTPESSVQDLRPLARAIVESIQAGNPRPDDPLMTMADFREAIFDKVQRLTRRTGEPAVYLPFGFDAGFPILNRKP